MEGRRLEGDFFFFSSEAKLFRARQTALALLDNAQKKHPPLSCAIFNPLDVFQGLIELIS